MKKVRFFIGLYNAAIFPLFFLPQINKLLFMLFYIILTLLCPEPRCVHRDKYYIVSLLPPTILAAVLIIYRQYIIGAAILSASYFIAHTVYWRKSLKSKESQE